MGTKISTEMFHMVFMENKENLKSGIINLDWANEYRVQ